MTCEPHKCHRPLSVQGFEEAASTRLAKRVFHFQYIFIYIFFVLDIDTGHALAHDWCATKALVLNLNFYNSAILLRFGFLAAFFPISSGWHSFHSYQFVCWRFISVIAANHVDFNRLLDSVYFFFSPSVLPSPSAGQFHSIWIVFFPSLIFSLCCYESVKRDE